MPSTPLRTIDVWLLRRYPYLWSLQLPLYVLILLGLTTLASVVASIAPIDDIRNVGRFYVIWVLLSLLPFCAWMWLFLRIDHPVQRKGTGRRAAAILGTVAVSVSVLMPVIAYVGILEYRVWSAGDAWSRFALALARAGFDSDGSFPYHNEMGQQIVIFALGWLAYMLHFFRHAPRATFVGAFAFTMAVFALAVVLSTIDTAAWRLPLVVNLVIVLFGSVVLVFPARWGKHSFVLELWLCMWPMLGLSVGLAAQDLRFVNAFEQGALVCWIIVCVSPVIYIGAERLRSRPA